MALLFSLEIVIANARDVTKFEFHLNVFNRFKIRRMS